MQSVVSATKEQVSVTLGDNMVILSLSDGVYYGLNEVGQDVWDMIKEPMTVADICAKIIESYDVTMQVCERDVCALLEQLAQKRLIVVQADESA